jgi:periplasmic iron binding protein
MNKVTSLLTLFILSLMVQPALLAQELIIGEELIEPGIRFIFEGAVKDNVTQRPQNLEESKTDVHIEARVNWASDPSINVSESTPRGGFVAYMNLSAEETNERTGETLQADLIPHINLVDNLHCARNIPLPGEIDDSFTVVFHVLPPEPLDLALHKDWRDSHGSRLFNEQSFRFTGVDFEEIARATRR